MYAQVSYQPNGYVGADEIAQLENQQDFDSLLRLFQKGKLVKIVTKMLKNKYNSEIEDNDPNGIRVDSDYIIEYVEDDYFVLWERM